MEEHRLTRRLLRHWDLIRRGLPYPDIQFLNAPAIEDVWPYCFQVGVDTRKGISYKYEYMGQPIAEMYGENLAGRAVDHNVRDFPGAVIHKRIPEAVEIRQPIHDEGHFVGSNGKLIKYRACILPFGNPSKGITHVVVGLSCRVFN